MAKQSKKNKSENYLDYIPVHNKAYDVQTGENGGITIFVENKGIFNRIAQRVFKKPKVSQIHLDEMGNFIWPLMDGERSVYDIAVMVHEQFGEKAEPLYNRLVSYIRTLESYGFIRMVNKIK
jgi:hypothetical protein